MRHFEVGAHGHGDFGGTRRCRRPHIRRQVDQRPVRFMADGGDHRNAGGGDGAGQRLVIEPPKILEAAAAARHDQQVGLRYGAILRQCVEAVDGGGHFGACRFALHPHRPDQHMQRKPVLDPVDDVADDRACRRGDDADDARHERQQAFAAGIEQAFGLQPALALFQQCHQRPGAGRLQIVDDDLVGGLSGIGGEPAGGDHLHAFLGAELQPAHRGLPDHGVEPCAVVLEAEIGMAGGVRPAIA